MLNDKTMEVFDGVMKFLSAGEYVIVPKTDVREVLDNKISQGEIDASLNMLQMNELVQIRYADSEVYCLTVLPKGIRENEKREEQREEERKKAELLATESELQSALSEEKIPPTHPEEDIGQKVNSLNAYQSMGNIRKLALICGLSSFFGTMVAGLIVIIIILSKVG